MDLRAGARIPLRALKRALSTGPASAVIDRLGVRSTLSDVYWHALFRLSTGRCRQSVGQATVTFRAASAAEFRHYRSLVGERPVVADLLDELERGDVVFDVGAYLGVYTCLVAAVLPPNRVVAFEPRTGRADRIESNLATNDLDAAVRRLALADAAGTARMSPTGGSARIVRSGGDGERVETVPGDALVSAGTLPQPTVVKLDVEGAELDAVRGLRRTLADEACRLIYCEVHPDLLAEYGGTEEDLRETLESLGFAVDVCHRRGREYFFRATK